MAELGRGEMNVNSNLTAWSQPPTPAFSSFPSCLPSLSPLLASPAPPPRHACRTLGSFRFRAEEGAEGAVNEVVPWAGEKSKLVGASVLAHACSSPAPRGERRAQPSARKLWGCRLWE